MQSVTASSKADKSVAFFKETKINSCSHVVVKHGQPMAVAYPTVPLAKIDEVFPMSKRSVSQEVHRIRSNLYAGMQNKPLERYHPDAHRSRLRMPEMQVPYKNSSSVIIGDRNYYDKKHFVTTAKMLLKKPKPVMTNNLGILSEKAKWQRHMNE
jgi:hypothetical protein